MFKIDDVQGIHRSLKLLSLTDRESYDYRGAAQLNRGQTSRMSNTAAAAPTRVSVVMAAYNSEVYLAESPQAALWCKVYESLGGFLKELCFALNWEMWQSASPGQRRDVFCMIIIPRCSGNAGARSSAAPLRRSSVGSRGSAAHLCSVPG